MTLDRRIIHILDDLAMGGVTRALKNFEHPTLAFAGQHETVDIREDKVRATSKNDIAVVHFTANWKKLGWLLDLRVRGGFSKIVLIEHTYTAGFEASEVEQPTRFRAMLKCAYALVDVIVAVSKNQREWMLKHKLTAADKVLAIPQSRECDELFGIELKPRENTPLKIGAFGRFHKQKGFDLLIEAMARIPVGLAELKIAGTGPEINHLKLLAKDLPHVEICEPFTSPRAFLESVDAVAIPSRWEAFGLVGTEARAAGRPIIAARVDGLDDQLDRSAFAHAPNNVSSIVRAIRQAARATDFDARCKAARNQAAGEFRTMLGQWLALFVKLSKEKERPRALDLTATV